MAKTNREKALVMKIFQR